MENGFKIDSLPKTNKMDKNDEVALSSFDLYIRWENNNIDIDWID